MSKRKRPGIIPTIAKPAVDQEALLQELKKKDVKDDTPIKPKVQRKIRFTMDLPADVHAKISNRAEENGQTIKGYILKLVKADLLQYDAV